jgi:tRNA threonylcarbamoyl adenosine modification protein YeaZ
MSGESLLSLLQRRRPRVVLSDGFAAVGSGVVVVGKCCYQITVFSCQSPVASLLGASFRLCHAGGEMTESQSVAESGAGAGMLVLGVDTCGPSGTVALARVGVGRVELLGQAELAGKRYSATLVSAVEGLLNGHGVKLADVGAIVVVHGPGSFTGVRVGLSAVKGLAEPGQIPVVAVSRLAVLAAKAGVGSAALDAHRHEVFLRLNSGGDVRELLAGAEELGHFSSASFPVPSMNLSHISESRYGASGSGRVAVCDDAAAGMIGGVWSEAELIRVEAPTAADAIRLCAAMILDSDPSRKLRGLDRAPDFSAEETSAGRFVDLATLDGHYLRRSDAEIFGDAAKPAGEKGPGVRVRRMGVADLDAVMEIAAKTDHAPRWGRAAYVAAIDPGNQPRRVVLVAERDGGLAGFVVASITAPEAELESIVTAVPHQRLGVARELFGVLKAELRRQGVREVMLEVREGNHSAQGLYRFLGFREEGRRPGYYAEPVEDAVLMRLGLR